MSSKIDFAMTQKFKIFANILAASMLSVNDFIQDIIRKSLVAKIRPLLIF